VQQLLTGKKRLPGFSGEWKEVKLGEIGEIQTGNTPSKLESENWNGEYYWCTAEDMKSKYVNNTAIHLVS
jgi:type I restriction enzyme S subunit